MARQTKDASAATAQAEKAPKKAKAATKKPAASPSKKSTASATKKSAAPKAAPRRSSKAGAGRPSRLSREIIIDASFKLLAEYSAEGLTLARVAEELDTVSMALYNYFPSREALLAELANHACKQFQMPKRTSPATWQQTLEDWFWTLRALAEEYPMMIKVMGIDGKVSSGWMRITRIVGQTLYQAGFREYRLAMDVWLFCCMAHSLIQAEVMGGFHSPFSLSQLEDLEPEEQDHFLMLRPYHEKLNGTDLMQEGFSDLIVTLERKLAAATNDPS